MFGVYVAVLPDILTDPLDGLLTTENVKLSLFASVADTSNVVLVSLPLKSHTVNVIVLVPTLLDVGVNVNLPVLNVIQLTLDSVTSVPPKVAL